MARSETQKGFKLDFSGVLSSPIPMWKSRISWRITLSVFLTILVVQAGILGVTIKEFEHKQLDQLRETARVAIAPMLSETVRDFLSSPLNEREAQRLISTTIVNGLTVYSSQLDLIATYGEPLALVLMDQDTLARTYRSADGGAYEVILRANDLGRPYVMAVRLDSSNIQPAMIGHVKEAIVIMLLMSAFVTSVLMVALGRWLLEPVLFMRENLLEASRNPEDPKLPQSPFDPGDEIGSAIEIAQNLIRQNAENIGQIRSTAEDKIHRLAYYDTLTGLPNRTLFLKTLSERISTEDENKNDPERFSIVALDLDHFKDINDTMGHNVGDMILRGVGKRLREAFEDDVIVSRTGEDEFAIMAPLHDGRAHARGVAEKVISVIRDEPFKVFNETFQIRASVGLSVFPDDNTDPDAVLKNADIALNRAKEEGRDIIKEYSEDFDRAVQERFRLLRDLRDALEHDQLQVHFQPQFDLKSGKMIGAEALIRWWKPDNSKEGGHFVPPGHFIPVAEQSGLIVPIGARVLEKSCAAMREWKDKHGIDICFSVNVSGAQFMQNDFCEFVEKTLKTYKLEAASLELEVTESVFMDDINHTVETLKTLNQLGINLAIDDFGTGYSSLSYLRQFPIDRLKIDQSFVRNALNNRDDAAITRTILALGHSLNLKVIAEGVETKEHEQFLVEHGCDEVQGFRYAKPMPSDEFVKFSQAYSGDLSSFDKDQAA